MVNDYWLDNSHFDSHVLSFTGRTQHATINSADSNMSVSLDIGVLLLIRECFHRKQIQTIEVSKKKKQYSFKPTKLFSDL